MAIIDDWYSKNTMYKIHRFVGYFLVAAGIVLFVLFGLFKWPGLHWDGSLYTTPILNLASGNGWRFGSYTHQLVERPSDEYSIHGVLYPIFFGILLKTSTYESLFLWSGIINALTFVIYTFLFYRCLNIRYAKIVTASLFGFVAGFVCLELQGRPEHLAPLIISIPLLAREFNASKNYSKYLSYITIGLLFILSPIPGVMYGMGVLFWLGQNKSGKKLWAEIIIAGLIAAVTSVLLIELFCEFSTITWLTNTFLSGAHTTTPKDWSRLTSIGFFLRAPAWNFLVLIVLTLIFINLCAKKQLIILIIWFLLGLYLLPYVQYYGYTGFFPLLLLMIAGKSNNWLKIGNLGKKYLGIFSFIFSLLYLAVLARITLLFLLYVQYGTSFAEAKLTLGRLTKELNPESESVAFLWLSDPSFVALSQPPEFFMAAAPSLVEKGLDPLLSKYEAKFNKQMKYFILPELGHFTSLPSEINQNGYKYNLVYDGWSKKRAYFMGLKLGGAIPGYQFALYQRIK